MRRGKGPRRKLPRRDKKSAPPSSQRWIAPILVVLCGLLAYCNSFQGPFIGDDLNAIRDNSDFGGVSPDQAPPLSPRGVAPLATTLTNRPVLWVSFKLDFLIGGQEVAVYHATNLLIHLTSALLLYGIVRRNLSRHEYWGNRFENSATGLAAAVAAIWVVHPLQTESVTYIIQRAESLAGMFYLLVIYCLIRAADSRQTIWRFGAVAACALGMATKEVVATAPLMALIYDRTFLAGSFAAAIRSRWKLYAGLAMCWVILAVLVAVGKGRGESVGFDLGISPLGYARTQLGVIAHYLRLVVWPTGLVMDARCHPIVQRWTDISLPGLIVALLILASLIALWKKPLLGFIGTWFFLILAPSSSIVPIVTEIMAEHRMYLSLAAMVTLAVVATWMGADRLGKTGRRIFAGATVLSIVVLMVATIRRNEDYRTADGFWRDAVAKAPNSWDVHYAFGSALSEEAWTHPHGSPEARQISVDAAREFARVLELFPSYSPAAEMLGHMLIESGDLAGAETFYGLVLQKYPDLTWDAYMMRGTIRGMRQNAEEAKADFQAAIALKPNDPYGHFLLALTLLNLNDPKNAEQELTRALQIKPDYPDAATVLSRLRGQSN